MRTLLIAMISLMLPGVVLAKGPYMEIRASVESFTAVGDSLEIVFSGTISHVSGNGSEGDQWGFAARVKQTKLIIPNRSRVYFFTQGPLETHNLKDEFERGSKIYGRKGFQIQIAAYDPVVHFDKAISRITCGSACLSIVTDAMSDPAMAPAPEESEPEVDPSMAEPDRAPRGR